MKRSVALWTAIFTGPLVWFLSFGARWSLSGWVCAFRWKPALFAIAIVSVAIAAGSGILGWTEWQRVGREMPGEGGGAIARYGDHGSRPQRVLDSADRLAGDPRSHVGSL